jgi:hypothetical protein
MKKRIRFGVKHGGICFPNAGVLVFKMDAAKFNDMKMIVEQLKAVLPGDWGGRIVCEES